MNPEEKFGAVNTKGEIIQNGQVVGQANPLDVPISSATLSGNEFPVVLPKNDPTSDPFSEILSQAEVSSQAFNQAEAETKKAFEGVKEARQKESSTLDDLKKLFGLGTSAYEEQKVDEAKIDPFRQELTNINTELANTTVEYRGVQDQIKGRGDIAQEAQQGLLFNAQERYGRVLADLAIRQGAANQNIEQLERASDRKLALALAPIDRQITYLKDFVLENDKLLTQDEKDIANATIARQEKIKADLTADQKSVDALLTTALQNGIRIPDRVISEMLKNPKQATAILARNGISLENSLDRQIKLAQLAKINAESAKLAGIEEISPYQKERQTRILDSVKDLKDRVSFQTVGIVGAIGKGAPASIPRNFANDLSALRANIAFGELTAMREASKTGGALGQVSNIELGLLESALAGLDQGQSPANFRKNLQRVEDSITRWQGAVDKYGVPSSVSSGVLVSPDGTQQVDASQLTPEQLEEARNAGWQ